MAGLTQVVLGLFLQFTQPAEARTTAAVEQTESTKSVPASSHFRIERKITEMIEGKEYARLEVSPPSKCHQRMAIDAQFNTALNCLNALFKNGSGLGIATRNEIEIYERPRGYSGNKVKVDTIKYEDISDVGEDTEYIPRILTVGVLSGKRYNLSTDDILNFEDPTVCGAQRWHYNEAAKTALDTIKALREQQKRDDLAHETDRLRSYARGLQSAYDKAQKDATEFQGLATAFTRASPEQQRAILEKSGVTDQIWAQMRRQRHPSLTPAAQPEAQELQCVDPSEYVCQ